MFETNCFSFLFNMFKCSLEELSPLNSGHKPKDSCSYHCVLFPYLIHFSFLCHRVNFWNVRHYESSTWRDWSSQVVVRIELMCLFYNFKQGKNNNCSPPFPFLFSHAVNESHIVVQALRLNTMSKLTFADCARFDALVKDVFPGIDFRDVDYAELSNALVEVFEEANLEIICSQVSINSDRCSILRFWCFTKSLKARLFFHWKS